MAKQSTYPILNPQSPPPQVFYTLKEASELLGYAAETLRVYKKRGLIAVEKIGNTNIIFHEALVRFEFLHGSKRNYRKRKQVLDNGSI